MGEPRPPDFARRAAAPEAAALLARASRARCLRPRLDLRRGGGALGQASEQVDHRRLSAAPGVSQRRRRLAAHDGRRLMRHRSSRCSASTMNSAKSMRRCSCSKGQRRRRGGSRRACLGVRHLRGRCRAPPSSAVAGEDAPRGPDLVVEVAQATQRRRTVRPVSRWTRLGSPMDAGAQLCLSELGPVSSGAASGCGLRGAGSLRGCPGLSGSATRSGSVT